MFVDGTSLSLMKRLMYSQIMYNSMYVSFESGWSYPNNSLTPIGEVQYFAKKWANANQAQLGTFLATVAVVLDFDAGWTPPRHLYTGNLFRVWGNLPYSDGDHFTHAVFDQLYPRYADSSFYHNETGFQTPTPFGDTADVLLSDVESWLLNRYAVAVVASEICPSGKNGAEVAAKLSAFVSNGGTLVITAGSIANLPGSSLLGTSVQSTAAQCATFPTGTVVSIATGVNVTEPFAFQLCGLVTGPEVTASVLASVGSMPVALAVSSGSGTMIVLASPFGITQTIAVPTPITADVDQPMPTPRPMLQHVSSLIASVYTQSAMVFSVPGPLTFSTNAGSAANTFTVAVFNPTFEEQPLSISALYGKFASVAEIALLDDERDADGYLPPGIPASGLGNDTASTIAGGSVRIFAVTLAGAGSAVTPIPWVQPPGLAKGRALWLPRGSFPIRDALYVRPTFFAHFDSVVVDWRDIVSVSSDALGREAAWASLQNLTVLVDLSSGLNLYPDLRLLKNGMGDFNASMVTIQAVIENMAALGSRDLILSLHRFPENYYTPEQSMADFLTSIQAIAGMAAPQGILLHLRMMWNKPVSDVASMAAFVNLVGAPNVRIAPQIGGLLLQNTAPSILALIANQTSLFTLGCPQVDPLTSQTWSGSALLQSCTAAQQTAMTALLAVQPTAIVALEAAPLCRRDSNCEFLETALMESIHSAARAKANSSSL